MALAYRTLLIAFMMVLASCQTTEEQEQAYGFLWTPPDHVAQILDKKDIKAAMAVRRAEAAYFDRHGKEPATLKVEARLTRAVQDFYQPLIDKTLSFIVGVLQPPSPNRWAEIKSTIRVGRLILQDFPQDAGNMNFGVTRLGELSETIERFSAALQTGAPMAFVQRMETMGPRDFFAAYPVPVETEHWPPETLSSISAQLINKSPQDIVAFFEASAGHRSLPYNRMVAETFFHAYLNAHADRPLPQRVVRAVLALQDTDFGAAATDKISEEVSWVVLSGNVRANRTATAFFGGAAPPALEQWKLPSKMPDGLTDKRFLIFFYPLSGVIERETVASHDIHSEYLQDVLTVPNPVYLRTQELFKEAKANFEKKVKTLSKAKQGEIENCSGYFCLEMAINKFGADVGIAAAKQRMQDAENAMNLVSPTVEKPVFSPYRFKVSTVRVSKQARYALVFFDTVTRSAWSLTALRSSEKDLELVTGLKDSDRHHQRYAAKYLSDEEFQRALQDKLWLKGDDILPAVADSHWTPMGKTQIAAIVRNASR